MNVSKEQAKVYLILTNIILKFISAIVFLAVFIWITYSLLNAPPTWEKTLPITILDTILAGTVYQLSRHFFPTR
ncbi:hypothetical protein BAS10_09715 [Elizabethkingia meningoseptica]|nr:hypothetical protein BAS10_09715 [Elizabethkingia meningoseptica]